MSDTSWYSDLDTAFGSIQGNGHWAILSRREATGANDCGWDRNKRRRVSAGALKYWTRRVKTKPFTCPSAKHAYVKVEGEWFPTAQVIHVAIAVKAKKFVRFVSSNRQNSCPTLMVIGSAGSGIVASMDPRFVERRGDKVLAKAKYGVYLP